jgi:hypothetical protein
MRVRSFLAVGSALLLTAVLPVVASAGPFKVKHLQAISAGPSLFPAGCPGAFHDAEKPTGLEIEPAITANPANPRNLVATWKQDVSPAFNARDDVVASSLDGGKTWQRSTIPGLTRCTGGTSDTASDPWVSAGGDGTVYFGGQSGLTSTDPPLVAIAASHSVDGGRHWAMPATVSPRQGGNEQPSISGSPTLQGHAYMVWANFLLTIPPPWANTVSFSRTTDSGTTWSPPVLIDQPGPFAVDQAPRLLVLPNGTLLTLFVRIDGRSGLGLTTPHDRSTRDEPGFRSCRRARNCLSWSSSIPRPESSSHNRTTPASLSPPTAPRTLRSKQIARRPPAESAWPSPGTAVSPGAAQCFRA